VQAEAERRLKAQTKKDQGDLATQSAQSEYRIAKLEETHKREIEDLKRKQQEALANITKTKQG
jgi:hypothetical protein